MTPKNRTLKDDHREVSERHGGCEDKVCGSTMATDNIVAPTPLGRNADKNVVSVRCELLVPSSKGDGTQSLICFDQRWRRTTT